MRRLIAAVLMIFAGSAQISFADDPKPAPWGAIRGDARYVVEAQGDPWSEAGATVLAVTKGDAAKFGGAATRLDAAPLRGRQVVLSADLLAATDTAGGIIWLRADDESDKPVAFANSQNLPVLGGGDAAAREIAIVVPAGATKLVLGTGFQESGRLEARHLRLQSREAPPESLVPPREVLDAAIAIVRQHALNSGKVDWDQLIDSLHAKSADAKTAADVYPRIAELLAALRDGHSFFSPPSDTKQYQSTGLPKRPPVVQLIEPGVGYILVPGFAGSAARDATAFADKVADDIDALAPRVTVGWVVDLRRNHGGNMWPMLAGVKALLGDGVVGKFRDAAGETSEWRAGDLVERTEKPRRDLSAAKVAVLLDDETASSGEAVAVAFSGRPSTRSFGESTIGLSSANAGFPLPDGSQIFLTTSVDVNRDGKVFGGKVEPDERVEEAAGNDLVQKSAVAWLKR